MNIMNIQTAQHYADTTNKIFTCTDFHMTVDLTHSDGTRFHITNALLNIHEGWVFVFSEHHAPVFYPVDEITVRETYNPIRGG